MTDRSRHDTSIEAGVSEYADACSMTEAPIAALATSQLSYYSIKQLSDSLRRKKISASELPEHTINRIEKLTQRINAVVVRDFERARQAAVAADIALVAWRPKAFLLGIPMTIKEAFDVSGPPTTWGFPRFKDHVPKEDAVVVARAKREGAILLGKTNVPMGLGDFQSYNDIYMERRTTPGRSAVLPAAHRADRPPLSPPGSDLRHSGRTLADRCVCRPISAASTLISQRSAWFRSAAIAHRHRHHCRTAATSPCSARWQAPPPTWHWRST